MQPPLCKQCGVNPARRNGVVKGEQRWRVCLQCDGKVKRCRGRPRRYKTDRDRKKTWQLKKRLEAMASSSVFSWTDDGKEALAREAELVIVQAFRGIEMAKPVINPRMIEITSKPVTFDEIRVCLRMSPAGSCCWVDIKSLESNPATGRRVIARSKGLFVPHYVNAIAECVCQYHERLANFAKLIN